VVCVCVCGVCVGVCVVCVGVCMCVCGVCVCVCVCVCRVDISGFYKHKLTHILEVASGEINFVILQGVVQLCLYVS